MRLLKRTSLFLNICFLAAPAFGSTDSVKSEMETPAPTPGASEESRNFYEVLRELLGDFEYDLVKGNISPMRSVAIRNIALSENVPSSFKAHLELIITEKLLQTTRTKVIQCLACKARRTKLLKDEIRVISPAIDPIEVARLAREAMIDTFLDVAFQYQSSGMILSLTSVDTQNDQILWTKTYHSEYSRAATQRRGADFEQLDEAKRLAEYTPTILNRLSLYFLSLPSFPDASYTVTLGFRSVERYDNRKKEVGFEINHSQDASSIVIPSLRKPSNIYSYFSLNLSLYFLHTWNFFGQEENYNHPRGSLSLLAGGVYASGYLSLSARLSYEYRLAKHFVLTGVFGYRPPASLLVGGTDRTVTLSGLEYGLGVGYLF
jgi:hypothetical protein